MWEFPDKRLARVSTNANQFPWFLTSHLVCEDLSVGFRLAHTMEHLLLARTLGSKFLENIFIRILSDFDEVRSTLFSEWPYKFLINYETL